MKRVFLSAIAALFLVTGCTKTANDTDGNKDQETTGTDTEKQEEVNPEDIDTVEIEEETDIEAEEGDATDGM